MWRLNFSRTRRRRRSLIDYSWILAMLVSCDWPLSNALLICLATCCQTAIILGSISSIFWRLWSSNRTSFFILSLFHGSKTTFKILNNFWYSLLYPWRLPAIFDLYHNFNHVLKHLNTLFWHLKLYLVGIENTTTTNYFTLPIYWTSLAMLYFSTRLSTNLLQKSYYLPKTLPNELFTACSRISTTLLFRLLIPAKPAKIFHLYVTRSH